MVAPATKWKRGPDGRMICVDTGRGIECQPRDSQTTSDEWRKTNEITDLEFAEIGVLLCDHKPRDLALMIVRLAGASPAAR